MPTLVAVLVALGGGAGLATLAQVVLRSRAENRRSDADADVVVGDALQRRYDALLAGLEAEVARVRAAEIATADRLAVAGHERDEALATVGRLRGEVGEATAAVKLARAEIVRLQHHLDEVEDRATPPRRHRP